MSRDGRRGDRAFEATHRALRLQRLVEGAACCAARRRWRRSSSCTSGIPTRADARPERRLALADAIRLLQDFTRARVMRRTLRCGGRVLRSRGDGRVPRATGLAHCDQHDCHRLAAVHPSRCRCNPWIFRWPTRISGPWRARCVAQTCRDWGLTWGSLQQPFDIAGRVHLCGRRGASKVTAIDTHWIWQDGHSLTKDPVVRLGQQRRPAGRTGGAGRPQGLPACRGKPEDLDGVMVFNPQGKPLAHIRLPGALRQPVLWRP